MAPIWSLRRQDRLEQAAVSIRNTGRRCLAIATDLIEAGCGIDRIDSYDRWLLRFKTAMQALPEEQRQQSMLAILGAYREPQRAVTKSVLPAERFLSASKAAGFEMPPLSAALINKYVADLRHMKLV